MDIEPCTGEIKHRLIGSGQLQDPTRIKWMLRFKASNPVDYTRDYIIKAGTGTVLTKNGILAGQYVQPVTEWVQPELTTPGTPPIPNDFSTMGFLTKGVGKAQDDGNLWGPLSPFPQSGVTTTNLTCSETPPGTPGGSETPAATVAGRIVINAAGANTETDSAQVFVRADDTLLLTGSQTNGAIPASDLRYRWNLTSSSAGNSSHFSEYSGYNTSDLRVRFKPSAPVGNYTFRLNVTSTSFNTTGSASIMATLFTGPDSITMSSYTWANRQSGTIGVTCQTKYKNDIRVNMTLDMVSSKNGAVSTVNMQPSPINSGIWSYNSNKVDQPRSVTCKSVLGGSATRTAVTTT